MLRVVEKLPSVPLRLSARATRCSRQVVDLQKADQAEVFRDAQLLWQKCYGAVRRSGTDNRARRADYKCPRTKAQTQVKPSMAAWLRRRREQIREAAARTKGQPSAGNQQPDDSLWTEGHQKELEFTQAKRLRRAAEEVRAGRKRVLDSLSTEELRGVLKHLKTMKTTDRNYLRDKERERAARHGTQLPDLANSDIFVEDGALQDEPAFAARCRTLGSRVAAMQASCKILHHVLDVFPEFSYIIHSPGVGLT